VSNAVSRREQQKAATRARILAVAQQLFADAGFDPVTIIHIAAQARCSVQTVFNHFSSKEELFFFDRARWVQGAAAAVRDRAPGTRPKTALRRHLVESVEGFARASADPQHARMIQVLDSTPALIAYERGLHDESVALLAEELAAAWDCLDDGPAGVGRMVSAEVTASIWMAAVRSIIMDLRSGRPPADDEEGIRATVALTDRVLAGLDTALSFEMTDNHVAACPVG
jgi:AcrR family transcriptional regulator